MLPPFGSGAMAGLMTLRASATAEFYPDEPMPGELVAMRQGKDYVGPFYIESIEHDTSESYAKLSLVASCQPVSQSRETWEMRRREKDLVARFIDSRGEWNAPIIKALGLQPLEDDFAGQWYWRRGFIDSLLMPWADCLDNLSRVREVEPIREVELMEVSRIRVNSTDTWITLRDRDRRRVQFDRVEKGPSLNEWTCDRWPGVRFKMPTADFDEYVDGMREDIIRGLADAYTAGVRISRKHIADVLGLQGGVAPSS